MTQDDLPENYAELAKKVYHLAETERWPQERVFDLLKDPWKLVKTFENRHLEGFDLPINPVVERLIDDQLKRQEKRD